MALFAFVTWDGGGNVGPALGIARALTIRGHECRFIGYAVQRDRIEAQGFRFSALDRGRNFEVRRLAPADRTPALVKNVWACPEHFTELSQALAETPADLLVVDFMLQGALAWGRRTATPMAVLVHSALAGLVPPPDSPMGAAVLSASNSLRGLAGLAHMGRLNEAWEGLPTLVTTVPDLDPASTGRGPSVHYVGPIVEPFLGQTWDSPWEKGDGRPLVLVSFSTTRFWDQGSRIRNSLDALAGEAVRVLITTSEAVDGVALPPNAEIRSNLPHTLVLPMVSLTITHCGHGTVAASLAHGVPLLGLPNKVADQPFFAERVRQLGAGLALDGEAEAGEIRSAVREILANPAYATAARGLAKAIRSSPGAAGSALLLENAMRSDNTR